MKIWQIIIISGLGFFLSYSQASAQCYIDASEYLNWLCNNVRGAEQACYDSPRKGNFADKQQCEDARTNALPYDSRWQRMTRCVCEGNSRGSYLSPTSPLQQQEEKLIDEVRKEAIKEEKERKLYLNKLMTEKQQEEKFKNDIKQLSQNMRISSPPMTQAQKEQYRKALEQAYCVAYNSVKAAKLALEGKFEISKNLQTDIENLRDTAGTRFGTQASSCPKDLKFNIPEARASIEKDPQYVLLTQIANKMQTIIPQIEETFKNIQALQEKKKEVDKKIIEIKEKIKKTKSPKLKKELKEEEDDLTKEAEQLLSQSQEQLTKAEELRKEVNKAETELGNFKTGG